MAITAPTEIANLSLWLKAETQAYSDAGVTLCTNGDPVYQLNDLSGNARTATQATATNQFAWIASGLNGLPVLRGTNDYLVTTSFLGAGWNTACTIFVVCSHADTSLDVVLNSNSVAGLYMGADTIPTAYSGGLSILRQRSIIGLNTPAASHVQTFRYDGSTRTYKVNGVGRSVAATGNMNLSGSLYVGALNNGGFTWAGDIAEVIVYQAALTDLQVLDVEAYLYSRYGLADQNTPQVIFDGDSITAGQGATTSYPTRTMTGISETSWRNIGVSGQSLTNMNSDRNDQVETAVRNGTTDVVAVFGGTNDMEAGADAATTLSRMQTYHAGVRAAGYKTVAFTVLPRSAASTPANFNTIRATLNTSIRANTGGWYDALADVGGNLLIGEDGDSDNLTYYNGDKVHPNDTGAQIVADIASVAIASLLPATGNPTGILQNNLQSMRAGL
jgi:lysophospholipase L1-like esterase